MVRDGLLRKNEAFPRQRSTSTYDWGEKRDGVKQVRADDIYGSLYSSFSPCAHSGKHPVKHDFKHLKHSTDCAVAFHDQIDSGNEAASACVWPWPMLSSWPRLSA